MHLIMRYQTSIAAERGAQRLSAKYGAGKFAVIEDRAGGGDFCPFAVVSFPGYAA